MENTSLADENFLGPLCVNCFGEKYFFNLNWYNFAKTSAEILFEAKFAKSLFVENSLFVIVGTDSGLLPHYLQKKQLPRGSRYIFIEPEAILQALNDQQLLVDLDAERMACITMEEWAFTIGKFKIKDYFYIDAVQSFNGFCAENDHIHEYAELSWHITEVLSQLHWVNTVELGSEAFIAKQLKNLADNVIPAKLLENAFVNKTVILLAGGPSLDAALPWVRLNRQQLVVFAVSRISRQLLQADIAPDFVFSVDPSEFSFDVSKEMLRFGRQTTFVYSHHTVPTLVSQWLGRALYLDPRFPWKSSLNIDNIVSIGPTVTNTALHVAYCFGFKRIIFAGLDLCFTRDGFTHASGSNEHLAGPRFNLTSLQVKTNDGFMAPTTCDFAQAIVTMGMQARHLVNQGCQLINVSASAAQIESIDFVPLAEIALETSELDIEMIVAAKVDNVERDIQYYQKIQTEILRAGYQISVIARLSEKARRINEAMYNTQGKIENYKDKKQLDQIEKKFKREHRQFSRLVKVFGMRRFLKLTKPFSDQEWTAAEAKEFGNVFYDAYQEGTASLLNLFDDTLQRINARQTEFSANPDFSLLIEQTRKDKSFGRVRLWREKFSIESIPLEVFTIFDEFEQRNEEILQEKNTLHLSRAKSQSSLANIKQRAGLLFKHNKVEDLQALLMGLDKHEEQNLAAPYRYLVNAYLAELNGEYEVALENYQHIVLAADILLEEALVRIAYISIEQSNFDSATLSLQCLSQLNPWYLSMYAEVLRIQGNSLLAIDAYNSYIRQFPDDVLTQLKLAMLYVENNILDAAELMLDYILRIKPNLEAAWVVKNQLIHLKMHAKETVS
jgi:hypothetical protein